ncbi:MAG: type II toxin-antitoxin system HicB family antitoxin [Actinomycetota bacterium]|nr:type II toxin-antitoxin system HicB family antitoxin [Actinomycetota bacterium]
MTEQITYSAVFERDDNDRWFVHCPDVSGAHSHGRTLASARSNIREAIALVLDVGESGGFDLVEEIHLNDHALETATTRARDIRDQASDLEGQARVATLDAIERAAASDVALSMRDLADLLGISHQRVQQLSASTSPQMK